MADNKEITKVSLAMLEYYDSKIKAWHNENSNSKRYVVFATRENFPLVGDSEVLYIDTEDNKMYLWVNNNYVSISSGGDNSDSSLWGEF